MEVAHESAATKFAVGEDLESQVFLAPENAQNLPVFELLEFVGAHAGTVRLQKLFRPQEAAALVGSIFEGHGLLFYWPADCRLWAGFRARETARRVHFRF